MSTIDSENEAALARLNRERVARDLEPHIPPEHIVTGQCTFEALNRYLTLHPIDTIRAIEAVKMTEWMYPLIKAQQAANPAWGLLDIIGDESKPPMRDERLIVRQNGVCWVCGQRGDDMTWVRRECGSYQVHNQDLCIRLARDKPERRKRNEGESDGTNKA